MGTADGVAPDGLRPKIRTCISITGMKRDLTQLANNTYDLLVIGGGVHGACVAWDASLRGLSVALIDKGDFGHATSANSLKTVHGGLRYLQDADLELVRTMIHERMALMRIAPHLVHPLPCLVPTYNQLMKSKPVMAVALTINNLLCLDHNRLSDPQKRLPRGRIISRDECLQILPGLADGGITGGAIWHDAQMYNSERVTLSFILSAVQKGAFVANYVEAVKFLRNDERVVGIRAKDVLSGNELDIQARVVINTTGPWVNRLLDLLNDRCQPQVPLSIAMNLVTRQIIPTYALGVLSRPEANGNGQASKKKRQLLFIAPWRNYSLVGTKHVHCDGSPDNYQVSEKEIQDFIDQINGAYPGAALKREDVYWVHWGFLPAEDNQHDVDKVKLVRQGQAYDHQKDDGIDGLITVIGVKYTSARYVAQKAVDLAFKKLGRESPKCLTDVVPLYGGQIERFADFLAQETAKKTKGLSAEVLRHLIYNYGSEYPQILKYLNQDPRWGQTVSPTSQVIKAEVVHGIREEMAQKLADVILRRTELGSAGWPGESCLQTCANIMAAELSWDRARIVREMDEVRAIYKKVTVGEHNLLTVV